MTRGLQGKGANRGGGHTKAQVAGEEEGKRGGSAIEGSRGRGREGRLVAVRLELCGASGRQKGRCARQSVRDGEGHSARTSSRKKLLG